MDYQSPHDSLENVDDVGNLLTVDFVIETVRLIRPAAKVGVLGQGQVRATIPMQQVVATLPVGSTKAKLTEVLSATIADHVPEQAAEVLMRDPYVVATPEKQFKIVLIIGHAVDLPV